MDTQAVIRAFQEDLNVEVEQMGEYAFGDGEEFESVSGAAENGESEWVVFEDEADAERAAIENLKDMVEMEGIGIFNRDFVERYITVTDTDARMIAADLTDSRLEDADNDDLIELAEQYSVLLDGQDVDSVMRQFDDFENTFEDATMDLSNFVPDTDTVQEDQLVEEGDVDLMGIREQMELVRDYVDFEYNNYLRDNFSRALSLVDQASFSTDDLDFLEDFFDELTSYFEEDGYAMDEIMDRFRDEVRDSMTSAIASEVKDPVEFFVEQEGMYTMDELMEQSFITFNTDELVRDAVETDGIANTLDNYDGEEEEIVDPETGEMFLVYGTN